MPAPPGETLRLLPSTLAPWLGQDIAVTAQLLDAKARGVVAVRVTCVTSEGVLSARAGLEDQSGGAVSLSTEPAGLVRFTLGTQVWPPLNRTQSAALALALARLDPEAATPSSAAKGLAAFAEAYRAEASTALREAVDRLFDHFPSETLHAHAPWPVRPVCLVALAEGPGGRVVAVAVATLRLRNWLGGFYAALSAAVEGDDRLGSALKNLDREAEGGADLSRKLTTALQAFAALEQGKLASRLRDAATGKAAVAFLDTHAGTLSGAAMENVVRAAGASTAAIAAGGFAVFEAIRTVQDAGPVIAAPTRGLDLLGTRVGDLETKVALQPDAGNLRADLLGDIDRHFAQLEPSVSSTELEAFGAGLSQEIDTKLAEFESGATKADLEALSAELTRDFDTKLAGIGVTRADLDALSATLSRDFDTKLAAIGSGVTRADLDALRNSLTRDFDAKLATAADGVVPRTALDELRGELSRQIETSTATLGARIEAKADVRTVTALQTSLTQTSAESQALATRLNGLDQRLVGIERPPPIRPIR